jgi:hypothetical protein
VSLPDGIPDSNFWYIPDRIPEKNFGEISDEKFF